MDDGSYVSDLSSDEKVLMAIVRAAECFKRAHSAIFRNYGLSFPKYNVLRVLEASAKGRNKISTVSKILLVPGANITGIAKRLEKDGFIIRKSDASDERVTLLEITPKGRRALKNIEDEKDRALKGILTGLSENDKRQVLGMAKRVIINSQQQP